MRVSHNPTTFPSVSLKYAKAPISGISVLGWTTLPPPLILCADMLLELPPGDVVDAVESPHAVWLVGDWNASGNFGGAGGVQDVSGLKCYDDLTAMLADGEIDMIDLCLPSYLHRDLTIRALEAGELTALGGSLPVSRADIESCTHIVGQMGIAPFQRAFELDPLCVRCRPILRGIRQRGAALQAQQPDSTDAQIRRVFAQFDRTDSLIAALGALHDIPAMLPRIGADGKRLLPGDAGYEDLAALDTQGPWKT